MNDFCQVWEIARFAAIGQMSGCLTTESGRPYSEVVGGELIRFII